MTGYLNNPLFLIFNYLDIFTQYICFQRVKALENEMSQLNLNAQQQLKSKDEMIKNLQGKLYAKINSR